MPTRSRPTTASTAIHNALDQVAAGIEDPGLRSYFEMHRARFAFTLSLVTSVAPRPAGARILDVGYFPGHLAQALEHLGHRVTGVSSPDIPFERPDVHLVDIEHAVLPFEDDAFDVVVFAETIEHLPHSPVHPLREMHRVTRPGGALVVTTPNLVRGSNRIKFLLGRSPMFPLDAYFDADGHGAPLEHRHNREYTAAELGRLLEATGWEVERTGGFVAYAKWLQPPEGTVAARRAVEAVKYAAQMAAPSSRDSLFAVGRA